MSFAAGHDHGDARFVGCGDHLAVAHRSARLDHGGHPGVGQDQQAVGEREEGVTSGRTPGTPGTRLGHGDFGRHHP
jgi:hypothetical protein